ncbi:MAG: lysophospholipase L1-like esterase [Patiriisocius sp.]|jgi:lysophospholipase L1-like esterase
MLNKTKSYALIIFISIFAFSVCVINTLFLSPNISSTYYKEKVDLFEKLPKKEHQIVFVGDSITDNVEWHEFFPDVEVANRGIQGDTVNGLYNRLKNITDTKAHKVFLMIGINDLLRKNSVNDIARSYEKVVKELVVNHKFVFIQSTLHVYDKESSINENVILLNNRLHKLSLKYENSFFIDLNENLSANNQLKSAFTFDGLHLNGLGYQEWKDIISSFVYE